MRALRPARKVVERSVDTHEGGGGASRSLLGEVDDRFVGLAVRCAGVGTGVGAVAQLGQPLGRVRPRCGVAGSDPCEPFARLVGVVCSGEGVRVGVPKAGAPWLLAVPLQLGDPEEDDRGVELAEVTTRAGGHHQRLRSRRTAQRRGFRGQGDRKRPLRVTHTPCAVRDHREKGIVAAHPPRGAQLLRRLTPPFHAVKSDPTGLPGHGEARSAVAGGQCVLISGAGVGISQVRRGREMSADLVRKLLRQ